MKIFLVEGKNIDLPSVIEFIAKAGRLTIRDTQIYLASWPLVLSLLDKSNSKMPSREYD